MSKNKIIEIISELKNEGNKESFFLEQLIDIINNDKKEYIEDLSYNVHDSIYSFQTSLNNINPILALHFDEIKYKIFKALEEEKSIRFFYPTRDIHSNFQPFNNNVLRHNCIVKLPENISVKTIKSNRYEHTYQDEIEVFQIITKQSYCRTDLFDKNKNEFIKDKNSEIYATAQIQGAESERLITEAQVSFPIKMDWITRIIQNDFNFTAQPWNEKEKIQAILLNKKEIKTEKELKTLYLSGHPLSDKDKIKMFDIEKNSLYSFNTFSKETAKYFSKNSYSTQQLYYILNRVSDNDYIDELTINFLKTQENITFKDYNPLSQIKDMLSPKTQNKVNKMAIKSDPNNMRYLTEEEQTKNLVLQSVNYNGSSLRFVINKTLEICKAAVLNKKNSLKHVPEEFINEINLALENQKNEKKKSKKIKV